MTNSGTAILAVAQHGDINIWTTSGDPFQGLGLGIGLVVSFIQRDGRRYAWRTVDHDRGDPGQRHERQPDRDESIADRADGYRRPLRPADVRSRAATCSGTYHYEGDVDGDTTFTIASIKGSVDGSALTVGTGTRRPRHLWRPDDLLERHVFVYQPRRPTMP